MHTMKPIITGFLVLSAATFMAYLGTINKRTLLRRELDEIFQHLHGGCSATTDTDDKPDILVVGLSWEFQGQLPT